MRLYTKRVLFTILLMISPHTPTYAQSARGSGEGQTNLTPRIERLEEQLVDLQGAVAAVETLAKSSAGGGASGYSSGGSGVNSEQVRQLSEQIADLTQRLERLEARSGSSSSVSGQSSFSTGTNTRFQTDYGATPPSGFEDKQPLPPIVSQSSPADRPSGRASGSSSSLPSGAQENRASSQTRPTPFSSDPSLGLPQPKASGASSSGTTSGSARALYEQGLSSFNRREYTAAQTYFEQFLQQFPNDPLAGTANYWLAEAAFVSGEYKSAADRFLKTFTNYPSNDKAPEALLKLAISLRRLGENSAACDSFAELQRRFPTAPESITKRAEAERRRANCA